MGWNCGSTRSVIDGPAIVSLQDQAGKKGTQPGEKSAEKIQSVEQMRISKASLTQQGTESVVYAYRFGKKLGDGAFGVVQMATHRTTGRKRAIKTILKNQRNLTVDKEQFYQEVEMLKCMDHPNILQLLEFYEDAKGYYLVTELCTGGELFDFIIETVRFNEGSAAHFMKQILSAVAYCHGKNVVHCDLKPENFLLDKKSDEANIKVIDFGLSALIKPENKLNRRLGTPYYTAPEIMDQSYDHKVDIWSCGVIMYIMLCGYPPFNGSQDAEIFAKAKEGVVNFPDEEWKSISQTAKDTIQGILKVDPTKRPEALEILEGEWIQNYSSKYKDFTQQQLNNLNNLKSFSSGSKLQHAVMTFIATQILSEEETKVLRETFQKIDANGDGVLSREELYDSFYMITGDPESAKQQTDHIMEQADTDQNGFIEYSQWITSSIDKSKLLSKNNLKQAFQAFDKDGSGTITTDELKVVLNAAGATDEVWESLMKEADEDGNGEIDLEEFSDMMMKLL